MTNNNEGQAGDGESTSTGHAADSAEGRRPADAAALVRTNRQRRIDEIFGDTMPQITDDEREPGEHGGFTAEHYRRGRPPHHVG